MAEGFVASLLRCNRCEYEWMPRRGRLPTRCPRCRSIKWNEETQRLSCLRCGYEWISRTSDPLRCPECGTHNWNRVPTVYTCCHCNYTWNSKTNHPPGRCPSCFSRTWAGKVEKGPTEEEIRIDRVVTELHKKGLGCVAISIEAGIPYSVVREIVERLFPGTVLKS